MKENRRTNDGIWTASPTEVSWQLVFMAPPTSAPYPYIPCKCTLRNVVLKLLDYLLPQLFTKWWPSPHPCLWTTFWEASFIPNQDTHLFPMNQFTCGMFQTVFFEHSSTFPVFCCPCPRFFGTCCWHQIQNEWILAKKLPSLSVWTLNILSLKCIQLKIGWKDLQIIVFCFYSRFTQRPNLSVMLYMLFKFPAKRNCGMALSLSLS